MGAGWERAEEAASGPPVSARPAWPGAIRVSVSGKSRATPSPGPRRRPRTCRHRPPPGPSHRTEVPALNPRPSSRAKSDRRTRTKLDAGPQVQEDSAETGEDHRGVRRHLGRRGPARRLPLRPLIQGRGRAPDALRSWLCRSRHRSAVRRPQRIRRSPPGRVPATWPGRGPRRPACRTGRQAPRARPRRRRSWR